jgi:hypothetical protein
MKISITAAVAIGLAALLQANGLSASQDAKKQAAIEDYTGVDPVSLGVKSLAVKKDPKTGFEVGGKNATALIRKIGEINGRKIADLEADMRPEAASTKGFLGADEGLLGVLAEDNRFVVDESRLTHQAIAQHLLVLAAIGEKVKQAEFRYHGRRFRVRLIYSRGFQPSPFGDGTETNVVTVARNLDSGKEVRYSVLVPEMIRRYGFYEGRGTPYRVEPLKVLEVLDFLKRKDP